VRTSQGGRRSRRQIVDFIRTFRETQGYSPSVREIAMWLDIPTTSVFYHLGVLEREGIIMRREGQARTWQLVE
jgi:SOS-response transcriptional repressor LexA